MMIRLNRILLPLDFSDATAGAVRYACALTENFVAELHLLHVLEVHVSTTPPQFGMGFAWPERFEETATSAKKRLAESIDSEWGRERKIEHAVVSGSPFLEIIQYAKENEIDLIVMGTHGHSGLKHLLIGSVAENVVRKSPCPVLTVRPEGHNFVMP